MSSLNDQEKMRLARTSGIYDNIWQTTGKCVFCDLKDKYIIYEENGVVLTINIFPYIDGQIMAIPRRHIKSTNELTQVEWDTMRKFGYIAKKLFKKVHKYNAMWSLVKTGIEAQGTVAEHLHMHFIPFDSQDLCVWNYRDLKNTPLQNVEIYTNAVDEFIKSYNKFEEKYSNKTQLPIVCDLVIVNKEKKVLFQERKKEFKYYPDNLCFPGGHIVDLKKGLICGLQKEIREELNYEFSEDQIQIINSDISTLHYSTNLKKSGKNLLKSDLFLWNTYLLNNFNDYKVLKPGDDCEEIVWLDSLEIKNSKRIGDAMKKIIEKVLK